MSAVPIAAFPVKRLSHAQALWLKGSILITFLAASSAPSPLYAIYREAWGFSALTLTLVFSSYAFALLAALLVFGALSDHRGRRDVLLAALGLELVAVLVFRGAESVHWLLAARVVQGVATGIASSALSAGLLDLHRERGAVVNSVAPMVGLGVGALGASLLAQFAPAPTQLVFELLLVAFALQVAAALYLPETVERRAGAWRSLRPSLAIPLKARTTMWQVLPVNTAQWALGGLYFSLGPTLARLVTHNHSPLMGGALIGLLSFGSAAAILMVRNRPARWALAVGAAALAIGVGVTVAGVQFESAAAFFVGSLIAGLGFGAGLNAAVRSLVPLAAPHERAGLMSSYFVLSYLAFSVPAIVAGLFTGQYGLRTTALGYGLVVMAMAVAALVMMAKRDNA
ncbi:MFS transporter [Piscinibacter sp. XHJ-5]|uniref:MFS transporter n=1 Tax=Piscinibacter sp. XHJ-5 TaxID=3037797 RepID=UPI0024534568|nr:MFS transporter [Piscinibacter sp. XHJ-5]